MSSPNPNNPSIAPVKPLEYIHNPFVESKPDDSFVKDFFSRKVMEEVRKFHTQIPGYRISPLKNLSNLASMLGLDGIWVKDESDRMKLNSFKILGGILCCRQVHPITVRHSGPTAFIC